MAGFYSAVDTWDTDNVRRLLEDATLGLQKLANDANSTRFLGTLIAIAGRDLVDVEPLLDQELPTAVLTIIDGQQRLCTLIILNILLHDALRSAVAELAVADDDGDEGEDDENEILTWVKEHTDDFLEDIAKTFRFVGRRARAEDLYRYYPRIIRAYADQWARTQANARYESPVARFIWAYIQHIEGEAGGDFTYNPVDEDDDEVPEDHEAIVDVINSLWEAIEALAIGDFEGLSLLAGSDIATQGAFNEGLWARPFPRHLTRYLDNDPDGEDQEAVGKILLLSAFARYLNQRMAVTVVVTHAEDHAFDMFEALNTTGQPLTAFETFKPKVIEAEGLNAYATSPSQQAMDRVQEYLDRFKRADERQNASGTLMIPFALSEDGHKLEKHLNAQRRYLREVYAGLPDRDARRAFTKNLADTSQFVGEAWRPARGKKPSLLPRRVVRDHEAEFCLEALRDIHHDVAIAPIARFYAAFVNAGAGDRPAAATEYYAAIKAVTAFSMMWRASQGGTANIDGIYKTIMARGAGGAPALCRRPRAGAAAAPLAENLKTAFRHFLTEEGLDRATWVRNASQAAIYRTGQVMTRFLLFVASHDTAPDEDTSGLIVAGRQGAYPMLARGQWRHEANLTVEHIAPNSNNRAGWPRNIYNDQRTVHRLGNLVLMPKAENNAIGNRGWDQKRVLYRMFSARTVREAQRAMDAARAFGFNVDKTAQELAQNSLHLPMCEAIAQYDGA